MTAQPANQRTGTSTGFSAVSGSISARSAQLMDLSHSSSVDLSAGWRRPALGRTIAVASGAMTIVITLSAVATAGAKIERHLVADVSKALAPRHQQLSVHADGRMIQLSGTVDSAEELAMVQRLVKSRWGVESVETSDVTVSAH